MNNLLLIGIDNYKYQTNLTKCANDINNFKDILLEKFDYEESNIIQLINEDATFENVVHAFEDCKGLYTIDNLLIYFSGHGGLYDINSDEGFWALHDTNSKENSLSFKAICSYIREVNCKHLVIISDCCYSRGMLNVQTFKHDSKRKQNKYEVGYDELKSRYIITAGSMETNETNSDIDTNWFNHKIVEYLRNSPKNVRITELAQHLKKEFEHNVIQKPQASFLNDPNNEFGEFIMNVSDDYSDIMADFLGFGDFPSLISEIAPNLSLKKEDKYSSSESKVGFQILTLLDEDVQRAYYYMYLYQGINQKKTIKYIKENFPNLLNKGIDLIILMPKENQVNVDKRKNNILHKFSAKSVHYIDEYISKKTIRNSRISEDYLQYTPKNFVTPVIESIEGINQIDIDSWLENLSQPLLVIKGEGGIGKTTLAGHCADLFFSKGKEYRSVIFIECKKIRGELIRLFNSRGSLNLYDLYIAYCNIENVDKNKLTFQIFRLNIDAGNLLIILDGLDELISHVSNFDVNSFLQSIISISQEFQKAKIVITCRTYFWNKNSISSIHISEISVLPFNSDQVELFFKRHFLNDYKKIESCKRVSKDFSTKDKNGTDIYLPYVLDVIRTIIESNYEILNNGLDEKTKYLKLEYKKDYVIYRACSREREKLNELSIDNQLLFFTHLAVKRRGVLRLENLASELSLIFNRTFDDSQVESFKSHILLKIDDNKILFKYDFFSDLFKSIYISNILNNCGAGISPDDIIDLISEEFWFNSGVLSDVIDRTESDSVNMKLYILSLYDYVISQDKLINENYKCLSGLLNFLLKIHHKFKGNNISNNTEILDELFSRNDQIEYLSLNDVYSNEDIRFNFSGKTLVNCNFTNYKSFWVCDYDGHTYFRNCQFFSLGYSELSKPIEINVNNIINPVCDDDFREFIKRNPIYQNNEDTVLLDFLKDFLKIFTKGGNVAILSDDRVIQSNEGLEQSVVSKYNKLKRQFISLDEMIQYGESVGIISIYPFAGKGRKPNRITISHGFRSDVISFVSSNTPSKQIVDFYTLLKNSIR